MLHCSTIINDIRGSGVSNSSITTAVLIRINDVLVLVRVIIAGSIILDVSIHDNDAEESR